MDFVGHSQDGMLPQYHVKFLGGGPKTNHVVGLAATGHGSTLLGLSRPATELDRTWPEIGRLADMTDDPATRQPGNSSPARSSRTS